MAWFLGVITNYYATATSLSYPWKPKHFLYCLTHLTFPREAKGGMSLHFFSSQQLAQPFFSSSVWKALRFFCRDKTARFAKKKDPYVPRPNVTKRAMTRGSRWCRTLDPYRWVVNASFLVAPAPSGPTWSASQTQRYLSKISGSF